MKRLFIFLAMFLFTGCRQDAALPQEATPTAVEQAIAQTEEPNMQTGIFETYSAEELLADYNSMKNTIETYSPKLYADQDELEKLYESIESNIQDGTTKLEFLRLLLPLGAALNCGHTHIYQTEDTSQVKRFPIDIKIIDNKMYIVNNAFIEKAPVGSEITKINQKTVNEIIDIIKSNMSSDGQNETFKMDTINNYFYMLYLYNIEYCDEFTIEYKDSNSAENTVVVKGYTNDEITQKIPSSYDDWKQYDSMFEGDYAILDMNSFYPVGEETIKSYNEFLDNFFLMVKQNKIQNVILDIRGNGGGDPKVASHLFSYLETEEHPYWVDSMPNYYPGLKDPIPFAENAFEGDLYILMNGGCFSSTGHLLALLKYQNAGVFIGEETGGSFACTDGSKNLVLYNTKLTFRYSTMLWQVAAEGLTPGRGVMPDYLVAPTLDDYLNERDAVLEFALQMIEEN